VQLQINAVYFRILDGKERFLPGEETGFKELVYRTFFHKIFQILKTVRYFSSIKNAQKQKGLLLLIVPKIEYLHKKF